MSKAGRPRKPITTTGPIGRWATRLRAVHEQAGSPSLRQMKPVAHYTIGALSNAQSGETFPSWELTRGWLAACKVTDEETLKIWRAEWEIADAQVKEHKKQAKDKTPAPGTGNEAVPPWMKQVSGALPILTLSPEEGRADPDPTTFRTEEDFIAGLKELREARGLSLRDVSGRSKQKAMPSLGTSVPIKGLSPTNIHDVLHGARWPRGSFVVAYVNACGGTIAQIEQWLEAYRGISHARRMIRFAFAAMKEDPELSPAEVGLTVGRRGEMRIATSRTEIAPLEELPPRRARPRHRPARLQFTAVTLTVLAVLAAMLGLAIGAAISA